MPKFMQTLDQAVYDKLQKISRERGITIQELIRAVIMPEWLKQKGTVNTAGDVDLEETRYHEDRSDVWRTARELGLSISRTCENVLKLNLTCKNE